MPKPGSTHPATLAFLLLGLASGAPAQDLGLPFTGRWFVVQGGDTLDVNHHMVLPSQAYGVDFAKVGGPRGCALAREGAASVPAPLAACGNSGHSDFPHVHLHVQDGPRFGEGNGLNPLFGPIDVELTGMALEGVTWPLIRGLFVSNAPPAPE